MLVTCLGPSGDLGDHDDWDRTSPVCCRLGNSRMEWTLRLVGMGIDGQSRSKFRRDSDQPGRWTW